MKKSRFHKSALQHFSQMNQEKLQQEIDNSLKNLLEKMPKNHREQLVLASNFKRVEVLKVILKYRHTDILVSELEQIAVLVD